MISIKPLRHLQYVGKLLLLQLHEFDNTFCIVLLIPHCNAWSQPFEESSFKPFRVEAGIFPIQNGLDFQCPGVNHHILLRKIIVTKYE